MKAALNRWQKSSLFAPLDMVKSAGLNLRIEQFLPYGSVSTWFRMASATISKTSSEK
jgi:hypothetical protein